VARTIRRHGKHENPIAVFVDLVPGAPPTRAYAADVARLGNTVSADIVLANEGGAIEPESLVATVQRVAREIRDAAAANRTTDIHLYLRTPWVAALLLGRELNTYRVHLYELEQLAEGPPFYLPSIVAMSGLGGGPVVPRPALLPS
jgi:hypothetical protein